MSKITITGNINAGNYIKADNSEVNINLLKENRELKERVKELEKELKVTDELYNANQKVIDAIDDIKECPTHGRNCIPNALDWIKNNSK